MDELALECQDKMKKTLESLSGNFVTLRTGRASGALLDRIEVEYYGDHCPINQIASITVPEPRQILIKPYDKNDAKAIIAAINSSDLGINPISDGVNIRLNIPPLTEERRHDLVKVAKKYAEDSKIALRNIRRDYFEFLKDDDSYSDDLKKRIEADVQKVTDETMKKLEELLVAKEKEIMVV